MPHKQFKTYAPFGVATKRFTKIGFHPSLDVSGAMKKEITKAGPGSYNPKAPHCLAKKEACWKRKQELEEFSKFLGFRNANILSAREFDKSMRGPGSNDFSEGVFKKKTDSVLENVGFSKGKRFSEKSKGVDDPPPNAYHRRITEKMSTNKKSFTTTPTFEFDGFCDRFKRPIPSYHLPSNMYIYNDGKNTEDIVNRCASLRGPYDTFTGPRDGTTIKNHLSPPLYKGPEYFFVKPSEIEILLHHPLRKRYGVFLKSQRFQKKPTARVLLNDLSLCYRNPDDPGPATYYFGHFKSITHKPESIYPFESSKFDARPPVEWKISPGPGRYYPKPPKCMKMKRPSWIFLSKQERKLVTSANNYSYLG